MIIHGQNQITFKILVPIEAIESQQTSSVISRPNLHRIPGKKGNDYRLLEISVFISRRSEHII